MELAKLFQRNFDFFFLLHLKIYSTQVDETAYSPRHLSTVGGSATDVITLLYLPPRSFTEADQYGLNLSR